MKEQTIKLKIGKFDYTVKVLTEKKVIGYEIYRGKGVLVSGFIPKNQQDNLKLHIAEHLTIQAIYEIHHELAQLQLKEKK